MTPRQKLENQCRAKMVLGIVGVCAAYLAFLGLPGPWNLWIATPLAALSLVASFVGLWRWHMYQRNRPNVMIVDELGPPLN